MSSEPHDQPDGGLEPPHGESLRARIARLDPVPPPAALDPWAAGGPPQALLEAIMDTDPTITTSPAGTTSPAATTSPAGTTSPAEPPGPRTGPDRGRPAWPVLLAAAAAVAVVVGAAGLFLGARRDGSGDTATATTAPALVLTLPGGGDPTLGSCIQFDVALLAQAPVAFAGTATDVGEGTVTLQVDRWYRGGDAPNVVLSTGTGVMVSIDGVVFEPGGRYLVSAVDGNVNGCGFSGPASPELQQAFDEAFGP